jgi:predicted Zn-dependent peptidase
MISYEKIVLPNGLTVLMHEDKNTPIASISVLYKVGSRDEHPEKTGFAHLFEHLMFGGSIHIPDYDGVMQRAGGENNAYTNHDYTHFFTTLPAINIETALWLESDRMLELMLQKEVLDVQKKVVVEEFYETCLNQPYGDVWHELSALNYEKHPINNHLYCFFIGCIFSKNDNAFG